jgi:hypothetical protein
VVGTAAARFDDTELGPRESDFFFLKHGRHISADGLPPTRAEESGDVPCIELALLNPHSDDRLTLILACTGVRFRCMKTGINLSVATFVGN